MYSIGNELRYLSPNFIFKHLVEGEKSTFRGELSFQRSVCTAGLTVAIIFYVPEASITHLPAGVDFLFVLCTGR